MKILVVADLHYNLKQFDWVLEHAPRFDLVIIAGDLLDLAGHADIDTQIVVVVKYLNRASDMLFAMARRANKEAGVADVPWTPGVPGTPGE